MVPVIGKIVHQESCIKTTNRQSITDEYTFLYFTLLR